MLAAHDSFVPPAPFSVQALAQSLAYLAVMSGGQSSRPPAPGSQTSFPPPSGTTRANTGRQGPTAAQALRALLGHTDDAITPALAAPGFRTRPLPRPGEEHRLQPHRIVNTTLPALSGPAQASHDPWADITDPVRVEPAPSDVTMTSQTDPPAQTGPAPSAQPMQENYFWRDPVPPVSPRRSLRGPWTSDEGWVINPVLPSSAR